MENKIVDCRVIAEELKIRAKNHVDIMLGKGLPAPKLCVIQIGENPQSDIYIKNKKIQCAEVGIECQIIRLDAETTKTEDMIDLIGNLNLDDSVNGIIVQKPYPEHIHKNISEWISPVKDVDGTSTRCMGTLMLDKNEAPLVACTPMGIIHIFEHMELDLTGKKCLVVGRSDIVGKPMVHLLNQYDATVTWAHSKTKNIIDETRNADIIITAVGKEKFIKDYMVKDGAIIIDVGINRNSEGKMCGDVDVTDELLNKVSWITPVPYGVGQTTVGQLLINVCIAATYQSNIRQKDEPQVVEPEVLEPEVVGPQNYVYTDSRIDYIIERFDVNGVVKHFKGGIYKIIDCVYNCDGENPLILYMRVSDRSLWARPYDMFMSKVDKEKYPEVQQEYRMEQATIVDIDDSLAEASRWFVEYKDSHAYDGSSTVGDYIVWGGEYTHTETGETVIYMKRTTHQRDNIYTTTNEIASMSNDVVEVE